MSKLKRRKGMTVLELAVSLAVIAMVVSLLVPLIVASRDEVRRNECANNLRQLGQAWTEHENALGYLPSSGWGWRWTGDPDRGFGKSQPGGWAYDTVRFTAYGNEPRQVFGEEDDEAKAAAMLRTHTTPVPIFHCPERRPIRTYPLVRANNLANNLQECTFGCSVARIDYQANSGNIAVGETSGPTGDRTTARIPDQFTNDWNGVTFQVSELRLSQIGDGLSKTMAIGEKYLNADSYLNGNDSADDGSAFMGLNRDVNGYTATLQTGTPPTPALSFVPRRDYAGLSFSWTYGSAHAAGFNVVHCDSSVRFLNYDIDFIAFHKLGGRNDGSD